ncbi:MAG: hypothetical protein ABI399_07535 [Bauldia sp.]
MPVMVFPAIAQGNAHEPGIAARQRGESACGISLGGIVAMIPVSDQSCAQGRHCGKKIKPRKAARRQAELRLGAKQFGRFRKELGIVSSRVFSIDGTKPKPGCRKMSSVPVVD